MSNWAHRSDSSPATGTTSLSISMPPNTIDNDILLMFLMHKGTGYATVPGGWTLIEQNISGSTRGELYWKRASGESGSYSVTGLADIAIGQILCYIGGKLTGDIVHMKSSRGNLAGTAGTAGFTPTIDKTLLIQFMAVGGQLSVGLNPASITQDPTDYSLRTSTISVPTPRIQEYTTIGTDGGIHITNNTLCLPIHTITEYYWNGAHTFENVGIVVSLIGESVNMSAPARYYLSGRRPAVKIQEQLKGDWQSDDTGPLHLGCQINTSELTRYKVAEGTLIHLILTSNLHPMSMNVGRFMTPQLSAQTLSGTFTVCNRVGASWKTTLGTFTSSDVKYKVHMYVSVGNTAEVRTIVLDKQISTVSWATSGTSFLEYTYTIPTPVAILAGDRIVVEFGAYIASSPDTVETDPLQSYYTEMRIRRGCTERDGSTGTGQDRFNSLLAYQDGYTGFTGFGSPWFQFSIAITEMTVPAAPTLTNTTCAAAEVISSIPFKTSVLNTTQLTNSDKAIWYKWVSDRTGKVILNTLGCSTQVRIRIFTDIVSGSCGAWASSNQVGSDDFYYLNRYTVYAGDQGIGDFNVVLGRTYWIQIHNYVITAMSNNTGGMIQFEICPWEVFLPGDIIYPAAGLVTVWRNGQLVGESWDAVQQTLAGIAIDYTKTPMTDIYSETVPAPINTSDRLVIQAFSVYGIYSNIIDLQTLNVRRDVIDYIFDVYSPDSTSASTVEVNENGEIFSGSFGDGFHLVAGDEGSFENAISKPEVSKINKLLATHGDDQPGAPWPPAELFYPALEVGGTDYIRLRNTTGTLSYVSAGQYVPLGGNKVQQFNTTTNTQDTDPVADIVTGPGPNPGGKGIQPLSDGGILLCNGSAVQRYNSAGTLIQTYTPTPAKLATTLADVQLDVDNLHFWTVDSGDMVFYKFNLASGTQISTFETHLTKGTGIAFVIYNPTRFSAAPPPVIDLGGIYFINPTKATRHDSYYQDTEKRIPNPTIRTGLFGE